MGGAAGRVVGRVAREGFGGGGGRASLQVEEGNSSRRQSASGGEALAGRAVLASRVGQAGGGC